ncbi:MATE family efflux transporter [Danxiaibacter flavus]|uniref:Multidrug-efflux transporter n=1 Tax=Danxiaibacter flavus TaxID=3049108 RepID=A0ABV3ZEV1_9BACT|nr:MATE family efflux transporter [Chitinophagaceae bacterium DXS]
MAERAKALQLQVNTSNRQILMIAMPIAVSILIPQINFITNNIFLSRLGEQTLGVAGITGVFYLVFAVIGQGLNNGLQALIARRAGENRVSEIGSLFNQGVRISLILAAMSILITYLIAPAIFRLSLHQKEHVDMAVHFLKIRIWGLPFLYIYQMRNALLVGINQSKYLVYGTLAETISNIVLDYGFIYGNFGLPIMGFNGAAIASIIAEATGLFVTFAVMHWKGVTGRIALFSNIKYNAANIKLILVQSSPLIMQYAISIVSWEFFYILIEHHGDRDLAISNTMRNIFGLFGCISWSFAATSNMMVSNIIGQGLQDKVIELIIKIMKLSVGFALIIFVLLNLKPDILLQVYGQNEDFIQAGIPVVRVVSLALVMQSVSTVWLNAVVGTGNSKRNLVTETIAIVVYCIYVYFTLEYFKLSIVIGWASEWLYWIVLFVPSFLYLKSNKWRDKKI